LKLSGESAVEKCTLDGVRGLRVTLGATVHDVLYYMSPIYCQEIIDSVFFETDLSLCILFICLHESLNLLMFNLNRLVMTRNKFSSNDACYSYNFLI